MTSSNATSLATPPALPLIYRAAATARGVLRGRTSRLIYGSRLVKPLRRALVARAPAGATMVRVCGGALEGASMLVDLSCEKYYWLGTHEEHIQRLLRERLREGAVVYDIGAHAGFFSLLSSRLVGERGRVIAFEPRAENAARLRANAAANAVANIDLHEAAVSDRAGLASFVMHASSLEGYLSDAITDGPTAIVRIETIDTLVEAGLPVPQLLKIDVEGGEGSVIRGPAQTIAAHRPELLIEIHSDAAGVEVAAALPCPYAFRDADTGRIAEQPLAPGHYLGTPVASGAAS